ncbi:hypothetical protein Tco_1483488 [Tanacetum coccineum]
MPRKSKQLVTASSNTENKSEKYVCDNASTYASTSNPPEPSSKGFSNSAFLLGSRYDSHDVNDRVGKSIRSFVRRIIQMEKIKLFQSLPLLLLLMHTLIDFSNGFMDFHGDTQRLANYCLSRRYKAVKVRSKVRMGIMPIEIELALEQSQQGVSYKVSQSCLRHHLRLPTLSSTPTLSQAEFFWGSHVMRFLRGCDSTVIVLGYDGLPIQPVAPPSPDYIPGPEDP